MKREMGFSADCLPRVVYNLKRYLFKSPLENLENTNLAFHS